MVHAGYVRGERGERGTLPVGATDGGALVTGQEVMNFFGDPGVPASALEAVAERVE
jgi:hypothetical protein